MANKTEQPVKGTKLLLFKIFAIGLPLVLLFLLEIGLRVFNYGHNQSLFIKDPADDRYMVMNKYASEKFFSDTLTATIGNHELFQANKSPNTFRIFVLGESTTIGYPYFHNGSFHRWLQYRLMHMYPDKNFEVVNLSLTAVNSYTVLDFGKQLARYQPDAVLIYTGHNEYYGALGIGSTSSLGSNRFLVEALLKLRELKLSQLFRNIESKITGVFASKKSGDRDNLMKQMAARQEIPFGSADYQAGIDQYDKNMTELCSTLNNAKIPTFISTIVSNERGLSPFISEKDSSRSAMHFFNAGTKAYNESQFAIAKQDFDKAKEMDELRFRGPEAINDIIEKLPAQFPYVHLVDTKKLFEKYSPHGIIGSETILEHVHPTLYGYSIMSEAFFQAIQKQHLIDDKPERQISFDELKKEMPITEMDSLYGAYQILILKTGWPFNQSIPGSFKFGTDPEGEMAGKLALREIQWDPAMNQLFNYYKSKDEKAAELKITNAMVLEYPTEPQLLNFAANLNAQLNNYDEAAFYYRKQYMISPGDQLSLLIARLYVQADEPEKAIPYIPQDNIKARLAQIVNDKMLLQEQPKNAQIAQRIAANYKIIGALDLSSKYGSMAK
jgi:hypothetical protein